MPNLRPLSMEIRTRADIHKGATLQMEYLDAFQRYQEYLDGNLDRLFSHVVPDTVNGLAFFKYRNKAGKVIDETRSIVRLSHFLSIAEFYPRTGMQSLMKPLDVKPESEAGEWWKAHARIISQTYFKAWMWEVAMGRWIVNVERRLNRFTAKPERRLAAVSPIFYLPATDPANREYIDADVTIRRIYLPQNQRQPGAPNDGAIVTFQPRGGEAETATFAIAPGDGAATIGDMLKGWRRSAQIGIWTWGNDDSTFARMEPIMLPLCVAATLGNVSLLRQVEPAVLIPALGNLGGEYTRPLEDQEGNPSPQHNEADLKLRNEVIEYAGTPGDAKGDYGYLQYDAASVAAAYREQALMYQDQLSVASTTPNTALGLEETNPESGRVMEHLTSIARSRVHDGRENTLEVHPPILEAMGAPRELINSRWDWSEDPSIAGDLEERYKFMLSNKIITPNEYRARYNLDPIEGGDQLQQERSPQNDNQT